MATFVTKSCMVCNKTSTVDLTDVELRALRSGTYIQSALPNRDADFRELVKTGTHPKCWDSVIPRG